MLMKIASSTKLGSNTMHRRIRWRTWLSLTKGVSKNGIKFDRTNCNFFHLGTNHRIFFFFAVRWETVNSRAQNDCIVYNLKDAAMAKWTVIPECITILLQSQINSSRFWIELMLSRVPWWSADKLLKCLCIFSCSGHTFFPAVSCCHSESRGIEEYLTFLF